MRRAVPAGLLSLVLVAACGNDKEHLHPDRPDADTSSPWWQPTAGDARDWDVQVTAPFDFATRRTMYLVDLFDVVPQPTMMGTVTVPAGAQATTIAALHAVDTRVMCRVALGAIRLSDPDASLYPGYATVVNDRPDAPASGSVIGWTTDDPNDDADTRWLDLSQRTQWQALALARIQLAKTIGCDGIEAYRADFGAQDTGFASPDGASNTAWFETIATTAHGLELSAGVNSSTLIFYDANAFIYDWMVGERCAEFDECETVKPFLTQHKAVFEIDYQTDVDGVAQSSTTLCNLQKVPGILDGIIKNAALSGAFVEACNPAP